MVHRRLFWKIYLTLVASLVATSVLLGAILWFFGEAQREVAQLEPRNSSEVVRLSPRGPLPDVSVYGADGKLVSTRGPTITLAEREAAHGHWRKPRILRLELPSGGFALTRLGPPPSLRALRFFSTMLGVMVVAGLAAYPVTSLLTRRLERLRAGVARWGEERVPPRLEDHGEDEVALLARAFNAAATRLDDLLTSQKALLANASHELRSPLARLHMAVDAGFGETVPGASSTKARAEIVRNLEEMDDLVEELLLSSRLDHPEARKDRREVVDLLGLAAEEAVRHDANLRGTPVDVTGDPVLLRRLIRNLLENAVKHGRAPIAITVERDADVAIVAVTDSGCSITSDDRERIFEPFYRPKGSSERTGGWGLGLALVRQIAERHGGSVRCENAATDGTRFVVHLAAPQG